MNKNLALLACFLYACLSGIKAQDLSASDPVVQKYISESNQLSSAYTSGLTEKRTLIQSRQLLSLQPLIGYLDSEISYFTDDQSKPRLILSDPSNPNNTALKTASASMFASLQAEQTAFDQKQRQLVQRFEEEAKKLKWNDARLALGRAALTNSSQAEKQGSDLSALVKSVKELKVPSSILTHKTDKVYLLTMAEGSSGLPPEQALKIANTKFPGNKVHLFGPADTGGNLKDCLRVISGKGIETRCYINAGWNILNSTLKLPVEGAADFTYQEVQKPDKDDVEYISNVGGAPDAKNPKGILVYVPDTTLKPFYIKHLRGEAQVRCILVTVPAETTN